jgi:hypothetical protein
LNPTFGGVAPQNSTGQADPHGPGAAFSYAAAGPRDCASLARDKLRGKKHVNRFAIKNN